MKISHRNDTKNKENEVNIEILCILDNLKQHYLNTNIIVNYLKIL